MIRLTIKGQVKSGKNHMQITRTGRHFPLKAWSDWRDGVLCQIKGQIPAVNVKEPCVIRVGYTPSDRRRRDVPGMLDALFHCLERAGVIADDSLFWHVEWGQKVMDRKDPKVEIEIQQI